MVSELPTGVVTFVFTDIEGSTRLLGALGSEAYGRLQDVHARILREAIDAGEGLAIRTEGDAFFAVFRSPLGAVRAAVTAQRRLQEHSWPEGAVIGVRMSLHTGQGLLGGDDYLGIDVNRAARIAAAGHGGQIVISDATRALVERDLPEGVRLQDLGDHRLKDLPRPERLYQLVIEGLPSQFPPLKSLEARPNNLPLQLTSFVGREDEIAQAANLLADKRLVTLTGPGGTGKTRLALQTAAEILPRFGDGVFFIDLAPVIDPTLVPTAVAQALGLQEEPGRALLDTVADHLADAEMLLVLDNFEHILEAAPVVERLLGAARRLRILVTSRQPVHLYGEQEQPVPPLALPDPSNLPEAEALSQYEAVALFIDRARAARPGFTVTDENAPAVAELCARLDGLPLAIELAASRIKVLSPDAILSRLGQRLDLLTASSRNLPERQRTLRGAIEWSYGLLAEPERRLFARLSVFSGGADLEAADAVADPDGDLGIDTLDGLASLVDHSLVRETEPEADEPRFGMLETIRQYARERLDDGSDAQATLRRHAEHFLALAEASGPYLVGEDQVTWLDRLDGDHENFLAALEWTIDVGEADRGMHAAAAVWRFWHQRGHFEVGRRWLERLLADPGAAKAASRGRAHAAAGSLAYWQRDIEGTERHYEQSLALAREAGDRRSIAEALYNLGFVPVLRGTGLERAQELFQEALTLYEELDDQSGVARSKADIAFVFMMQGRPGDALPLLEQAVARSRELGDMFRLSDDLEAVGQARRLTGDHEGARGAYLEALDILSEVDNPAGIAAVVEMMSALESALGRHERAMRLFGAAEAINESIGGGHPPEAGMLGDPVGAAREAIGKDATDRALAEGKAMARDEAAAYARKTEG
jgi:predicted ATPase/class 3 adenylate cyclase